MTLQLVQSLNAQNKILCGKRKPNKKCGALNRNQSFALRITFKLHKITHSYVCPKITYIIENIYKSMHM